MTPVPRIRHCPSGGRAHAQLLTFYQHHPFADDKARVTSSYKCECGIVFTNTVVDDPAACLNGGVAAKNRTHHVAKMASRRIA